MSPAFDNLALLLALAAVALRALDRPYWSNLLSSLCLVFGALGQLVTLTFLSVVEGKRLDESPVCGRVAHVQVDDDTAILGIEFIPALNRRTAPALVWAIEILWPRSQLPD